MSIGSAQRPPTSVASPSQSDWRAGCGCLWELRHAFRESWTQRSRSGVGEQTAPIVRSGCTETLDKTATSFSPPRRLFFFFFVPREKKLKKLFFLVVDYKINGQDLMEGLTEERFGYLSKILLYKDLYNISGMAI